MRSICSSRPPISANVTSGVSSSTRSASSSPGSSSSASRQEGSTVTRSEGPRLTPASAVARRTSVGLPALSSMISRPSSKTCATRRTGPAPSTSRCSTSTMFSLSSTVRPGSSPAGFSDAAIGTIIRRVPAMTSALAWRTPSSSIWLPSTRTMVAKLNGGRVIWLICDLAFVSSLPARLNASASAWFRAMSRSFNAARSCGDRASCVIRPVRLRSVCSSSHYAPTGR